MLYRVLGFVIGLLGWLNLFAMLWLSLAGIVGPGAGTIGVVVFLFIGLFGMVNAKE